MQVREVLTQLGFKEAKAKIYLACLELGAGTAAAIADRANEQRTSVYRILDELLQDGLIEVDAKAKVKTFIALAPGKLVDLLEAKRRLAEGALPDFLNVFAASKFKPKMRFSEGVAGVKRVFEDILELRDETVRTFSPIGSVLERFGATYARHFIDKRRKLGIKRLALRQAEDRPRKGRGWEFYASDPTVLREVRYLPPGFKINVLVQTYCGKVAVISSAQENFAFTIESRELAEFMKQVFQLLWNTSKS